MIEGAPLGCESGVQAKTNSQHTITVTVSA
jgi:hypothetical protein